MHSVDKAAVGGYHIESHGVACFNRPLHLTGCGWLELIRDRHGRYDDIQVRPFEASISYGSISGLNR